MPPQENNQVQFEGDEFSASASGTQSQRDFADRLVAWGVARDRTQAQYILIGVIVVCSAIWIYFAFFAGSGNPSAPPPGAAGPGGALPGAAPPAF